MRKTTTALAVTLLFAAPILPAHAQNLGDIISGVAGAVINQELDRNTFAAAQQQNTIAAYRNYLTRFPSGAYRQNAELAIAALTAAAAPATPAPVTPAPITPAPTTAAGVEAALGLTRTDRILLQQQLTSLGYDAGVADGLWGRNTRNAISRWQSANKFTGSGYVTSEQVQLIRRQAGGVTVPPAGGTADDQMEERLLGLTLAERRDVQRGLTALGYSTRGTDGVFGTNTRRAISAWQAAKGERQSGYLTADQLRALRVEAGI